MWQPTAKKFTYSILCHLYKNTGRATIYRKRIGTLRSQFACDKKSSERGLSVLVTPMPDSLLQENLCALGTKQWIKFSYRIFLTQLKEKMTTWRKRFFGGVVFQLHLISNASKKYICFRTWENRLALAVLEFIGNLCGQ